MLIKIFSKAIYLLVVLLILILLITYKCTSKARYHPGGPYYYRSFSNYDVPIKLTQEIPYKEAISEGSYFIAYFNNNGDVESYSVFVNGKLRATTKYYYNPDMTLKRADNYDDNNKLGNTINYDKGHLIGNGKSK